MSVNNGPRMLDFIAKPQKTDVSQATKKDNSVQI